MRQLLLRALAPLLAASAAEAAESIVGTWATPGRCGRAFDTVARAGDAVRWRGTCDFGCEKGAETVTVTARLSKGRLRYRINTDGWNGPLQRCPD